MIYEGIKKGNLSDESVAEGFHYAIRTLRDQWTRTNRTKWMKGVGKRGG